MSVISQTIIADSLQFSDTRNSIRAYTAEAKYLQEIHVGDIQDFVKKIQSN